ncbi:MAG: tetratricopeptide repeat protein [Deltaproteobacteria bacterium]|nr:tetratricopeptide repeat protein [Deltaproteobacteria bacterium]
MKKRIFIFGMAMLIIVMAPALVTAVDSVFITAPTAQQQSTEPIDNGTAIKNMFEAGNQYLSEGRYERAIEEYNRIKETLGGSTDPNMVNAFFNRGLAYHMIGEYDNAIDDFSIVIGINPQDDRAYYHRGNALAMTREYDRAIEDYTAAIGINPADYRFYYNRGLTFQENSRNFDRAIEDFKQAIRLSPEDPKLYCFLGITYYKKHQYTSAASAFDNAVARDPNYAEAYTGRGQSYLRKGNRSKAIADFRKACSLGERAGCAMEELLLRSDGIPAETVHREKQEGDLYE